MTTLKTSTEKKDGILPTIPNLPQHVAIIMDGNGRWAKERGLPRYEGHRQGVETLREIVRAAGQWGLRYLTVYAFSVENWHRPQAEVNALMRLLERFLKAEIPELNENNVRLRAIGRTTDLPKNCQAQLQRSIEATAHNTGLTLILALSYGGRMEIIDAVRRVAREVRDGKLEPEAIDEKTIAQRLYTAEYPDPDLLIRTSGEMRVSNFLLWQISYAELWVTKTLWPDFSREHFRRALEEYSTRHRRFGGV